MKLSFSLFAATSLVSVASAADTCELQCCEPALARERRLEDEWERGMGDNPLCGNGYCRTAEQFCTQENFGSVCQGGTACCVDDGSINFAEICQSSDFKGAMCPKGDGCEPPKSDTCADYCCRFPLARRNLQSGQEDVCSSDTAICETPEEFCNFNGYQACQKDTACCTAFCTGLVCETEPVFRIADKCESPEDGGTICPQKPHGGSCMGDPHFKRWNGEWYDYHGVCDLVLLSNPSFGNGLGMKLHIRTTGKNDYSYIETAALQIGDDVLELGSYGEWFLNGVENAELPAKMGGIYPVTYHHHMAGDHVIDEKRHRFEIELSQNPNRSEKIVLNTWKYVVSVKFEGASNANFGHSVGLMGSFENGQLLARDGKTELGMDLDAMGQEWQVQESEPMLFQVAREPQLPRQTCQKPVGIKQGRRLGEATVLKDEAEAACDHWDEEHKHLCVYDVLAMEDLELALPGAF